MISSIDSARGSAGGGIVSMRSLLALGEETGLFRALFGAADQTAISHHVLNPYLRFSRDEGECH